MGLPTDLTPIASADGRVLKILVVDDTATNRQILQVFLKKLGFTVETAENGAIAVERFASGQPDLVLMDVMMPVMDGYEATRRIKAAMGERWVPVIFLSALDKEENLVAGLDAGGDDYLAKPINFVVLDAKLRSLVRTIELQRSLDESRRRIAAISDAVLDSIVTIDEKAEIQSVNKATTDIFGYAPEELLGINVRKLMPEPYNSAHDGYVADRVAGRERRIIGVGQRQVEGLRKDGSIVPIELGVNEMEHDGRRLFVGIMRDVTERRLAEQKLREHTAALEKYHTEREAENALAQSIMERLMHRPGLSDPLLQHWFSPAENFSGDIIACARSADGKLYALLADATGHGLSAAISVVPVLTTFYSLVEQAYSLENIAHDLNRQLVQTLPTSRFVAASLLCLDPVARRIQMWQGGMPPVLLLDATGAIKERFASTHIPLGIVEFDAEMAAAREFDYAPGEQLVLFSDGLLEADNHSGEMFGSERLEAAMAGAPAAARLDLIRNAVIRFAGATSSRDDISLMLLSCP